MKNKDKISEEFLVLMAEKFRMLGDPTRLAILNSLMGGAELNVSQVVSATERNVANVSKHLKQLAEVGLLGRRKNGPFVYYRLNDSVVEKLCSLVCDSLRRDIEGELKKNQRLLNRDPRK